VVALSTDKASNPINLYGATKLASDKLFVAANVPVSDEGFTRFSVVRYGNVMGSRGSIIPYFIEQAKEGSLPITDSRMTRFMISLEQGVRLVWTAIDEMVGGEIFVKKIPSMKIVDIAAAIAPTVPHRIIGLRPGEKIHEQMIGYDDAPYTYEYADHYSILPSIYGWHTDEERIRDGRRVTDNFAYTSDSNSHWMTQDELRQWLSHSKMM